MALRTSFSSSNRAIIGCSAIDDRGEFCDYDLREVRVTQAIIRHARSVILVTDSLKFKRSAPVRVGTLDDIDNVVGILHLRKLANLAKTELTKPTLMRLLDEPYFTLPPPKSTGTQYFSGAWLDGHLAALPGITAQDVQATLAALTVAVFVGLKRVFRATGLLRPPPE